LSPPQHFADGRNVQHSRGHCGGSTPASGCGTGAKTLGFDIDYKRLLKEFESRGTLLRAFYYTAIIEDQEFELVPLV
jgi:uncharacterized LabA/DUF88 family protein